MPVEFEHEALVVYHQDTEFRLELRELRLLRRELRLLRLERQRVLRVELVVVVRTRQEVGREPDREAARVQADEEAQQEAEDSDADAPRLDALHDTRGDVVLHGDLRLHACHDTRGDVVLQVGGFEALNDAVGDLARQGLHAHEIAHAPSSYIHTRWKYAVENRLDRRGVCVVLGHVLQVAE